MVYFYIFKFMLLCVYIIRAKACRRSLVPSTTTPIMESGNTITTSAPESTQKLMPETTVITPCAPIPRCAQFDDLYNGSTLIFPVCAPFLRGSCISVSQTLLGILTRPLEKRLANISTTITETCNCKNRSIETFCRYILPRCSFSETNNQICSEISSCQRLTIEQPCSDYCHNLRHSCFSNETLDDLNELFGGFGLTVTSLCDSLKSSFCWKEKIYEIFDTDCLASPPQTNPTSSRFAIQSTSIGRKNIQTELSFQSKIIISAVCTGVLIIMMLIASIVRCYCWKGASKRNFSKTGAINIIYETQSSETTQVKLTTERNEQYSCARDIENTELNVITPQNTSNITTLIEEDSKNSYYSIVNHASSTEYETAKFSSGFEEHPQELDGYVDMTGMHKENSENLPNVEERNSNQELNGYEEITDIRKNDNTDHTSSFATLDLVGFDTGQSEYEIME